MEDFGAVTWNFDEYSYGYLDDLDDLDECELDEVLEPFYGVDWYE